MGRSHYRINEDERNIVRSMIRLDDKRRRGKLKRSVTAFDRRIQTAIERAETEIDLGGAQGEVREVILSAIRENIISGTTWEKSGETYCGRDTFYRYSRRFQFLIARNIGLIVDNSGKQGRL